MALAGRVRNCKGKRVEWGVGLSHRAGITRGHRGGSGGGATHRHVAYSSCVLVV